MFYVFDYCSNESASVKDPGPGKYYSTFSMRTGVKLHHVNFKDQKDVCRSCRHRFATRCPKTPRVGSGINPSRTRGKKADGEKEWVVNFRSDRKQGRAK